MSGIYLDHNATTFLRAEARETWLEVQDELAGNPSSLHAGGRAARDVLDRARESVARALGVGEDEVVFTSGGTESNNLALVGALANAEPDVSLMTTAAEHASVLGTARALEQRGHRLHVASIGPGGELDLEAAEPALADPALALVSVQAANNEVGALQPLAELSARLRERSSRPLLHVDAVQALGRIPVDLEAWGADLASFSAHKVGGPVGVGLLVRRKGAPIAPLAHGGEQESGLRPGTEDAAGCMAAARAVELAVQERAQYEAHTRALVGALWDALRQRIPDARLIGPAIDAERRLPNTLNVLLPVDDGRVLVTRLDLEGLHTSAGSACASGSLEPSHVLLAMGMDEHSARAGLRLSVGRSTTHDEVQAAVEILTTTIGGMRAT